MGIADLSDSCHGPPDVAENVLATTLLSVSYVFVLGPGHIALTLAVRIVLSYFSVAIAKFISIHFRPFQRPPKFLGIRSDGCSIASLKTTSTNQPECVHLFVKTTPTKSHSHKPINTLRF